LEQHQHLTAFSIERLRLRQLDDESAARARAHLADCARCADLQHGLSEHHREFEVTLKPAMRSRLHQKMRREVSRSQSWHWVLSVAVPACVLVIAWQALRPREPVEPDLLAKGGGAMTVFVKRGENVGRLVDGAPARAGDALRFRVQPGPHRHLLISSVDAAGTVAIHVPPGGQHSARIEPGVTWDSPQSVVLDGTPGPARIFALFSNRPLTASAVRAALERLGRSGADAIRSTQALDVGAEAQQSILLEKAD
jgi:hypothetical protein